MHSPHSLSRAELAQIIVNEMYQLVGILDARGVNLESNQTSLDAAGLRREDVIGKYFWETPWWPEETRPMLKKAVMRAAAGEFVRFEVENKVRDGSIFVDFSLKPVRDSSGKVRYIIPEGRDITAKKQAESEIQRKNIELEKAYGILKQQDAELKAAHTAIERTLQTTQERLQLATEAAQLGFWDFNLETGKLFWDRTAQAMYGYGPGEFKETMDDFYIRLHPTDREGVRQHIESSIRSRTDINTEYRIVWPDGSVHFIVGKGRAMGSPSGKPQRVTGVVIEVTERKIAELALETRLRELAESMPQIVFMAAADGQPLYFNQRWFTYTGQAPGTESSESWSRAIHPDDLKKVLFVWNEARAQGGNPWELEYRLKRADGVYRWHLGRAVPSRDPHGALTRWYGAVTDIDDQKRAQLDLSHAVRMRDEFLSIASHELKTPLTSLKLQNEIFRRRMRSGGLRDEQVDWAKKALDVSDRQISRLTTLVDDMLDISRISSGKLSIQLEEFDLGEVVAETCAHLRPQFGAAGSEIQLSRESRVTGRWDRFRIEQVVVNLLTNALKYGAGKPVELRVMAQRDHAVLSVRDHGVGISPEDHSRIFERFERASDMKGISGLGLGLYITRHIVEMHGGTIRVESSLGKGSVFTVELPLNPPSSRASLGAEEAPR